GARCAHCPLRCESCGVACAAPRASGARRTCASASRAAGEADLEPHLDMRMATRVEEPLPACALPRLGICRSGAELEELALEDLAPDLGAVVRLAEPLARRLGDQPRDVEARRARDVRERNLDLRGAHAQAGLGREIGLDALVDHPLEELLVE